MKNFGQTIRAARTKKRLTQGQLADQVGIHHTYLSKIESGNGYLPKASVIEKLANCLELDLAHLLQLAGKFTGEDLELLTALAAQYGSTFKQQLSWLQGFPSDHSPVTEFDMAQAVYNLTLSVDDMLAIMDADNHALQHQQEDLYDLLMKVPGVESCDYDGHFGPRIIVTLCTNDSALPHPGAVLARCAEVIKRYLDRYNSNR